jgi:hypothetical protein
MLEDRHQQEIHEKRDEEQNDPMAGDVVRRLTVRRHGGAPKTSKQDANADGRQKTQALKS